MLKAPPEPAISVEEADNRLKQNGADLGALLAKADWAMRAGDRRSAGGFYAAAAGSPDPAHPQNSSDRQRAAQSSLAIQDAYIRHMLNHLEKEGFGERDWHPRFHEAIALMLGQRQRAPEQSQWPQMPSILFYPGLPNVDFVELDDAAWWANVEGATDKILAELEQFRDGDGTFDSYISQQGHSQHHDYHGMLGNNDWSSHHLIKNGVVAAEEASATLETLKAAPLCEIEGRTPSVLFSRLSAGAHIPPHTGMLNFRYICHLPLVVPGNGELRVGGSTREWEYGKLLAFDDTVEHEAFNRSDEERIVLIFDVWKPEIEAVEKQQLTTLFAAVDSF